MHQWPALSSGLCSSTTAGDFTLMVGLDDGSSLRATVDPVTGLGSGHIGTDVPFASVGLEFDPTRQVLYASTGSQLYEVEPTSGATTYLGAHSSALAGGLH